jgi:hypothetical protein
MQPLHERLKSWERFSTATEEARQRMAFLRQPIAKNVNPPELTKLVRIKRIGRGFIASGKPVELGQTVTLPYAIARDLVHLGKAEFVVEAA